MRRILAGIRAMISGVSPNVFGSSAGSPSGSEPSGSSRAARWPWVRWALMSDVAAWTAWSIVSSGMPGAAAGARAAARAAGAGRRGRGGHGRRRGGAELDAERREHAVVEAVLAVEVGLEQLEEAPRLGP